jgi:hypothetical protein
MSTLFKQNIYKLLSVVVKTNLEIIFDTDLDICNIIKLFFSDYVIFLTSKYFFYNFDIFCLKKNLLQYFDKYDVVYLNYTNKNKIINLINIINNFIKNSDINTKNKFMSLLIQESKFKNIIHKRMKEIYFFDNNIEPSILYKKILFSNQELFLPFNNYVIKKMEYKLRTFCQIAEKLGSEKIIIEYANNIENSTKTNVNINMNVLNIGGKIDNNENINNSIKIVLEYPNNTYDINLNKFYIINSILDENDYMITKQEFESDLELRFLIDARCVNLIHKYHTNFIITHMNNIEQKIFMKASKYGLDMGHSKINNESTKISILIEFIPLHNNFNIIDGTNIHVLREGFVYLSNIIKMENSYTKLLGFIKSHLNAIEKKWIQLPYQYNYINDISKIYYTIFNLNFKDNELEVLLRKYFENNLHWDTFIKFRDLILKGSDNEMDKINFITFQFYDILNCKKNIMDKINKYIFNEYETFINNQKNNINKVSNSINNDENENVINLNDIETSEFDFDDSVSFENFEKDTYKNNYDFFEKNKDKIIKIIITSFKKSFYFKGGLSDNVFDSQLLVKKVKNIIYFYFDYEMKSLNEDYESCVLNKNNLEFNYLIDEVINTVSIKILVNNNYKKNDTTPKLKNNKEDKISLLVRQQKIFINFLLKYHTFKKDNAKVNEFIIKSIKKKTKTTETINNNNNNNTTTYTLKTALTNNLSIIIPPSVIYKNYSKYKLFYVWENLEEVINYFD